MTRQTISAKRWRRSLEDCFFCADAQAAGPNTLKVSGEANVGEIRACLARLAWLVFVFKGLSVKVAAVYVLGSNFQKCDCDRGWIDRGG